MTDLSRLEELARVATPGPWSVPHFADDECKCNCGYVLSEDFAGAVCEVFVDNGLLISDGGNDAPPMEQARANAQLIAACDPQTILSLIERLRAAEERVAKREHAVFEQGWRVAASWSDRTDLFFDTGSPAYIRDRQAALALLDQAEAAGLDEGVESK